MTFPPMHATEPTHGGNFLALTLPILGMIKFNIGAELFLHECILLVLIPSLLSRNLRWLQTRLTLSTLGLALVWLFGLILTDLIRQTAIIDILRGWGRLILFSTSLIATTLLIRSKERVFLWFLGSIIPAVVAPFQWSVDLNPLTLWKFGLAGATLSLLCIRPYYHIFLNPDSNKAYGNLIIAYLLVGIVSILMNSRSGGAIMLLTAFMVFGFQRYRTSTIDAGRMTAAVLLICLCIQGLTSFYSAGAGGGYFGEEAKKKYDTQVEGSGSLIDVISGGRPESNVSIIAIQDSPWIGHGSWAKDYKYVELLYYVLLQQKDTVDKPVGALEDFEDEPLIPTHSLLLGSWVEAGIAGAIFWSYLLITFIFYVAPRAVQVGDGLALFAICLLPVQCWHIMFSPLAAGGRVATAANIAIIFLAVNKHRPVHAPTQLAPIQPILLKSTSL